MIQEVVPLPVWACTAPQSPLTHERFCLPLHLGVGQSPIANIFTAQSIFIMQNLQNTIAGILALAG
jgi:hypothetical protein